MKITSRIIALLMCSLFSSWAQAAEYESGLRLDFWLKNYSVHSQRAVIVLPGVEIANPASLNGKMPPPSQENTFPTEFQQALLETHGIELILLRDDLAVCKWTEKEEYKAEKQRTKSELAAIGLSEEKIPERIVADARLTVKVESTQ
ncbi:hypothetical protein [Coraliomargarita parva]|uniref:hypothetical protein n=1 Tax=Coraliomargarita parva TaxID=3014050 RepID=UPI0022B47BBA|nr:hypothetical protein [Coraliomargarita parva]